MDIENLLRHPARGQPAAATELEYTSVFELLAAVLLSAQATDVGVNKATRRCSHVAPTRRRRCWRWARRR
jgi:endonuclease-3